MMTSKTFNLGDGSESNNGTWAKTLIALCCLLVVAVAITVAIYAYKTGFGHSCGIPELDENGLSNWTSSAETVAFACFPGYFLESHTPIMVSHCVNGSWSPSPPACNYLPIRLDCEVKEHGLVGNITMWQESTAHPAFIYGLVDYENADRSSKHLIDIVHLSKSTCEISDDVTNPTESYPDPEEFQHVLTIQFNSTELKGYNKAEVHINLIFVDKNNTATLMSVHQDDKTFVLPNSMSVNRKQRDMMTSFELEEFFQ